MIDTYCLSDGYTHCVQPELQGTSWLPTYLSLLVLDIFPYPLPNTKTAKRAAVSSCSTSRDVSLLMTGDLTLPATAWLSVHIHHPCSTMADKCFSIEVACKWSSTLHVTLLPDATGFWSPIDKNTQNYNFVSYCVGACETCTLWEEHTLRVFVNSVLACLVTYLLTYSMQQSPFWEANWFCN